MMKLPDTRAVFASLASQKGWWVWFLKFGGLFAVFMVFFVPAQRQYNLAVSDESSLQSEIKDLKQISVNLLTPEELRETEQHVNEFETRLVEASQASKLLDFISEEADKNHLNVVQIYSDSPITARDESGKDLEFKGKKLMLLPINFRVETDYKSLGNFLKSLKDSVRGSMVVESLVLKKSSHESESLQCDITLSASVL